jgi:tRNA-2-methylthio-N6-dimethylallyladenosine synthase
MKTFWIHAFGCQMNAYDARRLEALMSAAGYGKADDPARADVIALVTCHIREKASEKAFSALGRLHKANPNAKFAVLGCVAKAEGENVLKRAPYVRAVLSSQRYHLLPRVLAGDAAAVDVGVDRGLEKFGCLPPIEKSFAVEFLQIQEGCDMFCSYCCVPHTRGREVSRPLASVVEEAKKLAAGGAVEINLLGQNVDAYEGGGTLADAIREIAGISEIRRIRYTTSYPSKIDDAMVALYASEPKLMPLVSLPMQSGSDRILFAMRRRYTREEYMGILAKIRSVRPDVRFSSDFIVGFPGETDEDFQKTLSAVEEAEFIQSFAFKYSPRSGTPAAEMPGQVPDEVKDKRIYALLGRLRASQDRFNRSCAGMDMDVLFTERGKKDGEIMGRNEYMQPVIAEGTEKLLGKIARVRIERGSYANLRGTIGAE